MNISKGTFDATHFQLLNGKAMQLGPNIVSTEIAQLCTVKTHRDRSPRKAGARRPKVKGRARSSGERTDASHGPFTRSKGSHGPIGGLRQMLVVGRPFPPDTSTQALHGPSDPRPPSRAASFLSPLPHASRAGETCSGRSSLTREALPQGQNGIAICAGGISLLIILTTCSDDEESPETSILFALAVSRSEPHPARSSVNAGRHSSKPFRRPIEIRYPNLLLGLWPS